MNPAGLAPVGTSCVRAITNGLNAATLTGRLFCSKTTGTAPKTVVWGYQFDNKAALFAAVYEEVECTLVADVAQRIVAAQPPDQLSAMRVGARVFLELCATPEVARIVLIDAPAVLGWDRWREVGIKYGLGVIEGMLTQAIADGAIPEQPVRASAHVMLAALDEAALYISRAADADRAREDMYAVCDRLISGIAGSADTSR